MTLNQLESLLRKLENASYDLEKYSQTEPGLRGATDDVYDVVRDLKNLVNKIRAGRVILKENK